MNRASKSFAAFNAFGQAGEPRFSLLSNSDATAWVRVESGEHDTVPLSNELKVVIFR